MGRHFAAISCPSTELFPIGSSPHSPYEGYYSVSDCLDPLVSRRHHRFWNDNFSKRPSGLAIHGQSDGTHPTKNPFHQVPEELHVARGTVDLGEPSHTTIYLSWAEALFTGSPKGTLGINDTVPGAFACLGPWHFTLALPGQLSKDSSSLTDVRALSDADHWHLEILVVSRKPTEYSMTNREGQARHRTTKSATRLRNRFHDIT